MRLKLLLTTMALITVAACTPAPDQSSEDQQVLIYAYNLAGEGYTEHHIRSLDLASGEEIIITSPDGAAWNATVTTARDVIYSLQRGDEAQIYRTDLKGSTHTQMTTVPGMIAFHPMSSPVDDLIVFSRFDTGNIAALDPADGSVTDLTTHEAFDSHPVFFPDGKRVLFSTRRIESENGEPGIFILDLESGDIEDTGYFGSYARPDHDGRLIVFSGWDFPDAEPDVYIAALGSGQARRQLTDTPYYDGHPAFTPDDTSIVFVSRKDQGADDPVPDDPNTQGVNEVYIMPATGGDWTRLTFGEAVAWHPEIISVAQQVFRNAE